MKLLRSRAAKILAATIGLPTAGLCGCGAYVQYRMRTKPVCHVFRPVVDAQGNLLLEGKIVSRPSTVAIVLRFVELLCIFLPVVVLYAVMRLREDWYLKWLNVLLAAVQRAGPAFVKAGQWSCTREDLFSANFRRTFKRLYNEVDVHPYASTLQVLQEELGCDPFTIFDSIEEKTVGSGSVGQVHLAYLKDTKDPVVVKVMHPEIVETIVKDFTLINNAARYLDRYLPSVQRFDLPALSLAWTTHLASQLDFRIEAQNLEVFRNNFRSENFVEFPAPIFSSQRMLVETFCKGEPADPEFLASLPPHARDVLANKGLNTWCQMLLRDNFIHGDMHPGNILIDCSDPHEPTVSLIDVGLCQQLSEHEAEVTHNLMESFVKWNSEQCSSCILQMSDTQRYADVPHFKEEMMVLFKRFRPLRNEEQVVTNVLQAIFDCIRTNHVQMDPPYVSLLFAVLILESFIMNLNPEFNMVRHAAPWLASEGHISKSVVKDLFKSRWDAVRRVYGIFTGRMEDNLNLEAAGVPSIVRASNSEW